MHRAPIFIGIFLVLGLVPANAQEDELMTSISVQLEQLVDTYVKESFLKHHFPREVSDLRYLFGPKTIDSIQLQKELAEVGAEMEVIRGDKGINFQTNVANNFRGALLEDDGTFYRWRTTTGFNWDLLKGGFVAQKQKLEQKRLEYEAILAEQQDKMGDLSYRKSFEYIIYVFNKEKLKVIQNRYDVLTQLLEVVQKMYYLRYSHWEDVLDVMSKKAETELILKNYLTYIESIQIDSVLKNRSIDHLPIFDLSFEEITSRGIDTLSKAILLEKNLNALDHQFHWSNNVNLSAQLRYSYYDLGSGFASNARDFVAGGLSISIPVPFNSKARKSWKVAKQERLISEYDNYQEGLQNNLLSHYYEYEYTHKQYVQYFYKKEQLAVNINRSFRKRLFADPDYSPMAVVDKLDELFSVDLELVDIQQKMYLKALKILSLIKAPDILPYIEVKDYNHFVNQYNTSRNLYCSAGDLIDYETNFLIEFFRQNGIKEIYVDAGFNSETYLKYASLLDASVGSDLSIRFAIDPLKGESTLASDLTSLTTLPLTPKIHLDLLSSLREHPEKTDEIVQTVINLSQAFDISIAVPLETDTVFLKTLLPYLSVIYVIPEYSDQLKTKFLDLKQHLGSAAYAKLIPVVLPRDFGTKLDMDDFIVQLVDIAQVDATGILSMGELIDLDKKIVGWHEEHRF